MNKCIVTVTEEHIVVEEKWNGKKSFKKVDFQAERGGLLGRKELTVRWKGVIL